VLEVVSSRKRQEEPRSHRRHATGPRRTEREDEDVPASGGARWVWLVILLVVVVPVGIGAVLLSRMPNRGPTTAPSGFPNPWGQPAAATPPKPIAAGEFPQILAGLKTATPEQLTEVALRLSVTQPTQEQKKRHANAQRLRDGLPMAVTGKAAARIIAGLGQAGTLASPWEAGWVFQTMIQVDSGQAERAKVAEAEAKDDFILITRALVPILKGSKEAKIAGAKALGIWGTSDSVMPLADLLDKDDSHVREPVTDALGKLKDPRGLEVVAKRLEDTWDRMNGYPTRALLAAGPVAEPMVIPYLKFRDHFTKMEACKILKEIGTEKSIKALEEVANSGNPHDKQVVDDVLEAIKKRAPKAGEKEKPPANSG
jgi:hypothetical protein